MTEEKYLVTLSRYRGSIGCALLMGCFPLMCSPFLGHVCWPMAAFFVFLILCRLELLLNSEQLLKELCYDLSALVRK